MKVTNGESPSASAPTGWEYGATAPGSTLYGRDGSPVGTAQNGAVTVTDQPLAHGLEPTGGSRLVLLELYQQAVDERDELLMEVEGQHEMMNAADSRMTALEAQAAALQTKLDHATLERNSLKAQTHDLAERLVTAQLKRLESEKRYLEAAIQARGGAAATRMPLNGIGTPSSGNGSQR